MSAFTTDAAGRTVSPCRADQFVPGLYVAWDLPDGAGGWTTIDPLRIDAIEPRGEGGVLFRFADHAPTPFASDTQLTLVCAPLVHPAWCRNPQRCEADRDGDGTVYHSSRTHTYEAETIDEARPVRLSVSMHRLDDPDGTTGPEHITLFGFDGSRDWDGPELAPADVRGFARMLLALADEYDGRIAVEDVRLGDEIETRDGWQAVTGVMHDAQCREVALYTVVDDEPAGRWPLGSTVAARRGPTNPTTTEPGSSS